MQGAGEPQYNRPYFTIELRLKKTINQAEFCIYNLTGFHSTDEC